MMTIHEARVGLLSALRPNILEVLVLGAAISSLAILGPFGTYNEGDWTTRIAFWLRTVLVGWVIFKPLVWSFERAWRVRGWDLFGANLLAAASGSILMSVWLWYFGPRVNVDRGWFTWEQLVETYLQVTFVAGGIVLALYLTRKRPTIVKKIDDEARISVPVEPEPGAMILRLLPSHLGQDVIALSMEDHYVRVHTAVGSELVLMRLSDAIEHLRGIEGAQVHRSWWVARHAVDMLQKDGRDCTLRLSNGMTVPVARKRMPQLRELSWFAGMTS